MRFVYATRPLPSLEFATASQRDRIPDDAEVFAVCDGAMTIRQQDEQTFTSLTDEERSTLQALITESQMAEVTDARANMNDRDSFLRRIWRRLFSI
jgi:hypothetical protein